MHRLRPRILLLVLFAAACGEGAPEALLAPESTMVAAGSCAVYAGQVQPIADSPKVFYGLLAGGVEGTLRIVRVPARTTGVVEHEEGSFELNRESGDVLFGDGIHGRRVPTGQRTGESYRYQAAGRVTERAAGNGDAVRESATGTLWLGGEVNSAPELSSLRYRLRLCDESRGP